MYTNLQSSIYDPIQLFPSQKMNVSIGAGMSLPKYGNKCVKTNVNKESTTFDY